MKANAKAKAKKNTVVSKQVVTSTTVMAKSKDNYAPHIVLAKHSVTEIMEWRNTASKRVDKARARMEAIVKEYEQLNAKSHKDIKWIRKLHNELSRKVFGHRDRSQFSSRPKLAPANQLFLEFVEN